MYVQYLAHRLHLSKDSYVCHQHKNSPFKHIMNGLFAILFFSNLIQCPLQDSGEEDLAVMAQQIKAPVI